MYTISLATLFSSVFIDILFKSERALLKQEYRPLPFKHSLFWSTLVWGIGLCLISENIIYLVSIESWAAPYIAIKCFAVFVKNSISAYNLPVTSRLRVYFSPMIYPYCILALCLLSYFLSYAPFYHFMLYFVLLLWTFGSLLPELLFLRKIKKSQTKIWYKKFLYGKKINNKILLANYGPWLALSTIPFIIQKSWDINLNSYSALVILAFICSFYFIERWTLRPWRSVQLDFFKWEQKIFITNRIPLIRFITFFSALIATTLVFIPMLNYFQFSSHLKIYLTSELLLYLAFANWLTEYQTLFQRKSRQGKILAIILFGASCLSLFFPFVFLIIKAIIALILYFFGSKKIVPLKNILNRKSYYLVTFKKRPLSHSPNFIWYTEKQCLVCSPKDILASFEYEKIATVKQVKIPAALTRKDIEFQTLSISPTHPFLRKKLFQEPKSCQFIVNGILGSDHEKNIFVRLISSRGVEYFLIPANKNKLLNKMQQSWFLLK